MGDARKRGLSLEETCGELAAMEYVGKDQGNEELAMNDVHAGNVRFAYQALSDAATPERK